MSFLIVLKPHIRQTPTLILLNMCGAPSSYSQLVFPQNLIWYQSFVATVINLVALKTKHGIRTFLNPIYYFNLGVPFLSLHVHSGLHVRGKVEVPHWANTYSNSSSLSPSLSSQLVWGCILATKFHIDLEKVIIKLKMGPSPLPLPMPLLFCLKKRRIYKEGHLNLSLNHFTLILCPTHCHFPQLWVIPDQLTPLISNCSTNIQSHVMTSTLTQ